MKFNSILKLTTAVIAASSVNAYESLKSKAGNFRIGVATSSNKFNNAGYSQAMANFNYMVAENACKMVGIQPQQGKYDFSQCDAHYNKAKELGMAFRGHCLVWHSMPPSWFENLKGDALKNAMVDHINKTLKYYEGKIDSWDVVNEAIDDSSNGPQWKMRPSFLYQNIPDFVDLAFKTARAASSTTKLFYNDYNTEGIYGKSEAVFNFVKDMKSRNIPIDGVGLQYHVSTQSFPQYEKINDLIGRYCQLGLEVHITEMDVKSGGNASGQAKVYSEALKACLSNSCCKAFLVWGVGDNDSWLGANEAGLLFDSNYQPKAAYNALIETLGGGVPAGNTNSAPVINNTPSNDAPANNNQGANFDQGNQGGNPWGGNQGGNPWDQGNQGGNPWGGNQGGNPWGGNQGGNPWDQGNQGGNPWGGNQGGNPWGGNQGGNPWDQGNQGGNPWGQWAAPPSNSAVASPDANNGNCAGPWAQCGGQGFNGPTCCQQGSCKKINEYYSQCQ
ncbi:hypothetical protein BCR36DRAFT_580185 [Piromyces finnis]|uniref:Beta-xylanase n=1 Tax=Piromyces finnis TaxID=1754191 RepID=A0A1Y1VKH7_9FUNG|nr:hypothetical protein BCR36DRAFT_580185 [Piromyces finnis]|eukprot:ORX58584.1 hypothetical protein BCR36DRAFT_580185 [Piromyces finnis]